MHKAAGALPSRRVGAMKTLFWVELRRTKQHCHRRRRRRRRSRLPRRCLKRRLYDVSGGAAVAYLCYAMTAAAVLLKLFSDRSLFMLDLFIAV